MAKILVAEDDRNLSGSVVDALRAGNHTVDLVENGEEALLMACTYTYDLLILDWMMPAATGVEVCSRYRAKGGGSPILMLTAREQIEDKMVGFHSGADDYLTKPFDSRELLLRVTALLRRKPDRPTDVIKIGCVELDPVEHSILVNGQLTKFTPREFSLMEFFLRHPDQVFSADALINRVWNSDTEASADTVRVIVNRLRKKLRVENQGPDIATIYNVGYKLDTKSGAERR